MKYYCMICEKELDYEPLMCCSGYMCGCYGMPIEPPVCSNECYNKLPMNQVKEDTKESDEN